MPSRTALPTTIVSGRQLELAPLETINYASLAARDPSEVEKLLNAARSVGFFYLDLREGSTKRVAADVQDVYAVAEQYFDQPRELKMKDQREGEDRGYKPSPHFEMFEIARDEMMHEGLVLPSALTRRLELLKRFSSDCNSVVQTMLSTLSDALELGDTSRFENSHRDGEPSDSGLNIIYGPSKEKMANAPETKHTDSGTLTLFFSESWGSQVEMPDTKQWAFVEPRTGHAIVNVANWLQSASGNRLHSCLHRVTQPADGAEKRYFISYFLRPEKATTG